jgi:hypothetical protein
VKDANNLQQALAERHPPFSARCSVRPACPSLFEPDFQRGRVIPSVDVADIQSLIDITRFTLARPCMCFGTSHPNYLVGISENDWISMKMVDLFSEFTILCSAVSGLCSEESCPTMSGRNGALYFWMDPKSSEYTKPTSVSARKYMDLLMRWAESYLDIFSGCSANVPTEIFKARIQVFFRRFLRIYVHLYCHHWEELVPVRQHLKYSLFHFVMFMREFDLLVTRKEAEPLIEIIDSFRIPNLSFPPE